MTIEWTKTTIETGECEKIEDVPNGARVTAVNDRGVQCLCEGCRKVIFDDEEYVCTTDDVDLCMECAETCKE